LEKKCVKPTENARKFGKSRKCSTIITFRLPYITYCISLKNWIFSSCDLIS
jgi:hypothetical protein